jgi:hypothetical protein
MHSSYAVPVANFSLYRQRASRGMQRLLRRSCRTQTTAKTSSQPRSTRVALPESDVNFETAMLINRLAAHA